MTLPPGRITRLMHRTTDAFRDTELHAWMSLRAADAAAMRQIAPDDTPVMADRQELRGFLMDGVHRSQGGSIGAGAY